MYYKHSGRFTLGGLAFGAALGGVASVVLAYVYGAGLGHIPEAHFAVFATLFFGGIVGVSTGFGLVWGHVRNKAVTIAVAVGWATLALYISWAVWFQSLSQRDGGRTISWSRLAAHPVALWHLVKYINHYGTWALDSGTATTGWQLWAVWIVEAALVLSLAIIAAVGVLQKHPYCETCGQWCRRAALLLLAPVQNLEPLKPQLEHKDLRWIEGLGAVPANNDHLRVELERCDSCNQFHTLSVRQVSIRKKKFGHPTVSSEAIVKQLLVGPAEAQTLLNLKEKLAQAPKVTAAKASGAAAGK